MAFLTPTTTQHRPRTAPTRTSDLVQQLGTSTGSTFSPPEHVTLHSSSQEPSFTFVCLGVGGGPLENDCSCYMLKPAHRHWSQGSVVIEGGSWLGALTRILENVGPTSAFADVDFPHDNSALRAGYIGSFAHSFLLTHAHLDHILGLVLGSASLPGKTKVYGLRPTLENLKEVFNGKIWPKLASFEDEGPIVYHLKALENQEGTKVDEDFTVIPFALSHGLNPSVPPAPPTPTQAFSRNNSQFSKRYSLPNNGYFPNVVSPIDRAIPSTIGERPTFTSPFAPERAAVSKVDMRRIGEESVVESPLSPLRDSLAGKTGIRTSTRSTRRPKTAQTSQQLQNESNSGPSQSTMASLSIKTIASSGTKAAPRRVSIDHSPPALDSTAFFITNHKTGKDVLFFGDVEPDCISRSPRNKKVWAHAAMKYAEGKLNTVFLECSFPASHPTEFLYGHLSVGHLYDELRTLSRMVIIEKKRQKSRRPKPSPPIWGQSSPLTRDGTSISPVTLEFPTAAVSPLETNVSNAENLGKSLQGLSIVIVHVKTALFPSVIAEKDTPSATMPTLDSKGEGNDEVKGQGKGEGNEEEEEEELPYENPLIDPRTMQTRILDELVEMEQQEKLGVRFVMAKQGMRIEC